MKKLVTSYTFDASAKTIDSADFTSLEAIQLITNVTDNAIIYNFADNTKGGSLAGTTLTLTYDTTAMSDADKLQIFIEYNQYPTFDGNGNLNTVQVNSPESTIVDQNGESVTMDDASKSVRTTLVSELPAGTQNIGDVNIASSVLPTGAATSAKQDTGNTSVASIDTKTPALGQALAATSVPVILPSATITTLTPPAAITGFATSAKQDSLLTELQLKADLTETQPVSLASVPAHSVNAGTNLNTSALALETGGNLATVAGAIKAEDAAHVSGDTGIMGLTVRSDSAAALAGTNGDYQPPITDNTGRLWVNVGANTATSLVPGTSATHLGKAEDAAHTTGDTGIFALGVRNDTLASVTSATGDYSQASVDTAGIVITAGAPRLLKGRQVTTITSSTTETTIATAVASTFLDIYGLVLTNTSATATEVTVRDATAGGTISSFMVPAGDTRGFMLPVDSAIPQATVNNNWTATCGTSVASLKVTVLYVKRV